MRSLMFLLVLVNFCSLQITSNAPLAADVSNCCMEFTDVKIPVKQVKSYYWTTSDCPRRAVVFQMISGKEFCVDPETTWLSGHVAKVDQRKTSAKKTTTTTTTTTAAASTTTTTATTANTQSPTQSKRIIIFFVKANSKCCMEFTKVKIPVRLVKSYYWTTSDCPRRAVVFQMFKEKEICVDPETTWVNSHVAKVDKRKRV